MKRTLFILMLMILFGCTPKSIFNDGSKIIEGNMYNTGVFYYQKYQIDSMCVADTLPKLTDWQYIESKDEETKRKVSLYFYLKQNFDLNSELLYKIECDDPEYKVTKRLTKQ